METCSLILPPSGGEGVSQCGRLSFAWDVGNGVLNLRQPNGVPSMKVVPPGTTEVEVELLPEGRVRLKGEKPIPPVEAPEEMPEIIFRTSKMV